MTEETIFQEALARSDADRELFLDHACAGQPQLRAAVEALLAAHQKSDNLLDKPPGKIAATVVSQPTKSDSAVTSEQMKQVDGSEEGAGLGTLTADHRRGAAAGLVIGGRYTFHEKIGEGGMGEVWVAKQIEPVKRKVALKLIKTGMDSRTVLQRFEQERQALALMDHPNIARVLDGGMTSAGQPYFVMELVNGLPLTRFCDEMKLTPKARLELFVPICQAVQHAHQKGIVHRDLKPANILVTMVDGNPVPKVIDFGVAKATSGKLTEETMSTGFGAVVGTLEYMSPEQAGFSSEDIDTRADIYSLGVILYELLTGLRPIDAKRLRTAAFSEMMRIIQEEEPSKPSTRLSTDESLASLAAVRQTEPRKLMTLLRGELDWVVMKCLDKQRDRRYETANALARDIQRYLADEAVEARPPSASYRIRKFLRRHKGPAVATGFVLLAMLAGIIGTSLGLVEANQQRTAADDARDAEAERAAGEERAKQEAQLRLKQAEKANEILVSVFANLNPETLADENRPLAEVLSENLDDAIKQLDQDSVADADDVIRIQAVLGKSLVLLGDHERGTEALTKAVDVATREYGADDPRTWAMLNALSVAYGIAGDFENSLPIIESLYAKVEKELGPDALETVQYLANLGGAYQAARQLDKARPLLEEALERMRRILGPEDEQTLLCMNNLATSFGVADFKDHALPLLEEAYRLTLKKRGPNHPKTYLCMTNLGIAYHRVWMDDKAQPLLEEAYQQARKNLGPDHPDTVHTMLELARFYRDAGQIDKALPLLEQQATVTEIKYGRMDKKTFSIQSDLAASYWSLQQYDKAISILDDLIQREEVQLGREDPLTQQGIANLGANYLAVGRTELALPLLEEAYRYALTEGASHPSLLDSALDLARLYAASGQIDRATDVLLSGAEKAIAAAGADASQVWKFQSNLGTTYYEARQLDKSIPLFEALLQRQEAVAGRAHRETMVTARNLAVNYQAAGRHQEALALFDEVLQYMEARPQEYPSSLRIEVKTNKANSLAATGETLRAVEILEGTVQQTKNSDPPDSQGLMNSLSSLGLIYFQSRRMNKSIPLYQELLELQIKAYGPAHPDTLLTQWNLGTNYSANRQFEQAITVMAKLNDQLKAAPGVEFPPGRELVIQGLAYCYDAVSAPDKAIELLETFIAETKSAGEQTKEPSYPLQRNLVVRYFRTGQYDKSIPLLKQLLADVESHGKADSDEAIGLIADLGLNYRMAERYEDAVPFLEKAVSMSARNPGLARLRQPLIECYRELELHDKAVQLAKTDLDEGRQKLPGNSPDLANLLAVYATELFAAKQFAEAEPFVVECLDIRKKVNPDVWSTYNIMSMLGEILLEQEKLDEAEALLLEGQKGLETRRSQIPEIALIRYRESLERLVKFYKAKGNPDESARWQESLDQWNAEHEQQAP